MGLEGFSRRKALLLLGAGAAVAAEEIIIGSGTRFFRSALLNTTNPKEELDNMIPNGTLIPEDERKGENFLISVSPNFLGSRCFDAKSKNTAAWLPTLHALPENTNVHLVTSYDATSVCLQELELNFPKLKFFLHPIPASSEQLLKRSAFIQDIVFATGSRDQSGRFIIVGSWIDNDLLEMKGAINMDMQKGTATVDSEHADIAMRLAGDEFLAQEHPRDFNMLHVLPYVEGGDMQIARVHGKTVLIIGPGVIAHTILGIRHAAMGANLEDANAPLVQHELRQFIDGVKDQYKKIFGVHEVIALGDAVYQKYFQEGGSIKPSDMITSSAFFHSDMIVKPATDPRNPDNALAFCTHISGNEGDTLYLEESQKKLRDAGFEVIQLPCGAWPALNYVNSTMFMKDGKKTVMVPQYDIPEDKSAIQTYEAMGFKTIAVDMSHVKELSPDRIKKPARFIAGWLS